MTMFYKLRLNQELICFGPDILAFAERNSVVYVFCLYHYISFSVFVRDYRNIFFFVLQTQEFVSFFTEIIARIPYFFFAEIIVDHGPLSLMALKKVSIELLHRIQL